MGQELLIETYFDRRWFNKGMETIREIDDEIEDYKSMKARLERELATLYPTVRDDNKRDEEISLNDEYSWKFKELIELYEDTIRELVVLEDIKILIDDEQVRIHDCYNDKYYIKKDNVFADVDEKDWKEYDLKPEWLYEVN